MIFVCIKTRYALEYKLKPDEQKPLLKQKVGHAFDAFESWCMQYHGKKTTQDKYSYVVYEIQPYAAVDLPKLMEQFHQHTHVDIGIGLGFTEDEADAAAEVAFNKGLKHPLLMTEALVDYIDSAEQESTISKSEMVEEPLDKSLGSNIKNALKGAAIAAMISSRGHAPIPQTPAPIAGPKEFVGPLKPTEPVKYLQKRPQENPYYKGTFMETHNPQTITHGMHDGMWVIGQAESSGGKDMDHGNGYDTKTGTYTPEKHQVYLASDPDKRHQKQVERDNRAWGTFGFRPYTAMDTYFKYGGKEALNGPDLTEAQFVKKFKTDVAFHGELVKKHVANMVQKYRKEMESSGNPLIPFRAYHHGDQKASYKKVTAPGANDKYDELVLRAIKNGVEAGRKFDFTPMFGNDAFGQQMHHKLMNMALGIQGQKAEGM